MAMARYNPTARAASRTMPSNGRPGATDPTRGYANTDGPGGSTVDYGPHKGGFSFAGLQSPRWDDRDPSRDMTPAMLAAEQAARQPMIDRRNELLAGNDAYQQAKAAGDLKGQIAAMTAMRGQMQQDRFVAQGGTPETWQNRYDENNQWPVPRSPSGNYQYGPGRPGPTPPNVAQSAPSGVRRGATPQANAPMSAGAPPSQNPMMQGYQSAYPQGGYMGGGAGVPTGGGWGSAGGMPGVPSGGGWGSAGGNPMVSGGADLNRWLAMQGGGNPGASMGGGEMGYMYGNSPMGGGAGLDRNMMISQQYNQGGSPWASMFSRMGGGVPGGGNMSMMGGVPEGFMRFGGYRPAATQSMMYPY